MVTGVSSTTKRLSGRETSWGWCGGSGGRATALVTVRSTGPYYNYIVTIMYDMTHVSYARAASY